MKHYGLTVFGAVNQQQVSFSVRIPLAPQNAILRMQVAGWVIVGPDTFYIPSIFLLTSPFLGAIGEVADVSATSGTIPENFGQPFATDDQSWQGEMFTKTANVLQFFLQGKWPVGTVVPGAYQMAFYCSYTMNDYTRYAGQ